MSKHSTTFTVKVETAVPLTRDEAEQMMGELQAALSENIDYGDGITHAYGDVNFSIPPNITFAKQSNYDEDEFL